MRTSKDYLGIATLMSEKVEKHKFYELEIHQIFVFKHITRRTNIG